MTQVADLSPHPSAQGTPASVPPAHLRAFVQALLPAPKHQPPARPWASSHLSFKSRLTGHFSDTPNLTPALNKTPPPALLLSFKGILDFSFRV